MSNMATSTKAMGAAQRVMATGVLAAMRAQWLVTGFMLVTVVAVGATAPLYRRFGARRLLFAALGFTAAGSLAGW